jgi:midasin
VPSQVEPARKVQDLSAETLACVNTLTQHLLLLDAAAAQQQQQAFGQLACQVQELCSSLQSSGATPQQQQQQQGASAGGGDSHSVADTVQQLQQLCQVLQQLQQLPAQIQALGSPPQQQQQVHTMHTSSAGHIQHVQQLTGTLQQLWQRSHTLLQDLQSPSGQSTAGRFEWVDGSLTKAIQTGTWVLLDNANLVNPTVLDRLNGLLEPGGVLQLDEAGGAGASGGRVVVPHPGFRLLLGYDPKHGEVSRAMRNRGVELFLLPPAPAQAEAAAVGPQAEGAAGVADNSSEVSMGWVGLAFKGQYGVMS